MSIISITACHELPVIMMSVRHIKVIKKASDTTQNHQEKTCTEHKSRDMLTHHTLNLTVKKVMKWLNHSSLRRNCCETNQITHSKRITTLVIVVKRTFHKRNYKKSEIWSKQLMIKWLLRYLNKDRNIQLNLKNQHMSVCLTFLKCYSD